jgi:hypothetical protein
MNGKLESLLSNFGLLLAGNKQPMRYGKIALNTIKVYRNL